MYIIKKSFSLCVMVIITISFIVLLQLKSHIIEGSSNVRKKSIVLNSDDKKNDDRQIHNDNNNGQNIVFKKNNSGIDSFSNGKPNSNPNTIKLLSPDELKNLETNVDELPAVPDVILRYESGMFGFADSEPILHVWRAPFLPFGTVWPIPASIRYHKDVFTLCENMSYGSSSKLPIRLVGVTNYILERAVKRYQSIICEKRQVSHYPRTWKDQETNLDNISIGDRLFSAKSILDQMKYRQRSPPSNNMAGMSVGEEVDINPNYLKRISQAKLLAQIVALRIDVKSQGNSWPSLSMNESYTLVVSRRGIEIESEETWGALRALETLSQLVWRTRQGRLFINASRIADFPRFRHRGVMLDTSRHYIPKSQILKNIEAMAMNKFNVFHWHITDDQSFPLVTNNHPEFAKYGSYDPVYKVYKPSDVMEIIEYARVHGIRVIPEIDLPSHTYSWRHSHPEVLTRCLDANGHWTGYYGPLNMAASNTYKLLESLYRDIINLFPDRYIHLGSDEVATGCVESNQIIQSWMHKNGMFTSDALVDLFTRKLQNIITGFGKKNPNHRRNFLIWQEAYDRNSLLKKGTIVQMWKSQSTSEAAAVAKQKIPIIYSACWYLDRLEYGAQWARHYSCDPTDDSAGEYGGGDSNSDSVKNNGEIVDWKKYVLGGEAAMWNEFFDGNNVLPRIWPLASAAAERLWSPSHFSMPEKAAPRIEEMRCRMLLRNIPTGVASGAGDCPQINEISTGELTKSSQSSSFRELSYGQFHYVSQASSLKLISQLVYNGFQYNVIPFITILILGILIVYLRIYKHLSIRKMMLLLTVLMIVYIILWISCQNFIAQSTPYSSSIYS